MSDIKDQDIKYSIAHFVGARPVSEADPLLIDVPTLAVVFAVAVTDVLKAAVEAAESVEGLGKNVTAAGLKDMFSEMREDLSIAVIKCAAYSVANGEYIPEEPNAWLESIAKSSTAVFDDIVNLLKPGVTK